MSSNKKIKENLDRTFNIDTTVQDSPVPEVMADIMVPEVVNSEISNEVAEYNKEVLDLKNKLNNILTMATNAAQTAISELEVDPDSKIVDATSRILDAATKAASELGKVIQGNRPIDTTPPEPKGAVINNSQVIMVNDTASLIDLIRKNKENDIQPPPQIKV